MQIGLNDLAGRLAERLKQPLPGPLAHEPVRAVPVGKMLPKFEHKIPPKPGSVMILLHEVDGRIKFPLIKRPEYMGAHSGQVSFPGGKAETGETIFETALREAEEEVGIRSSGVNLIGRLSDFFVIPSNFIVAPVICYVTGAVVFKPDPVEVSRILTADLMDILGDDAIKTKEITAAGKFQMMAPHFEIEGEVVWGATAMMLAELRMVVNELLR